MNSHHQLTQSVVWDTADRYLRKIVEPHEYGDYILPFTVLRRIECVLEPTKQKVLDAIHAKKVEEFKQGLRPDPDKDDPEQEDPPLTPKSVEFVDQFARHGLHLPFYNTSVHSLERINKTKSNQLDALLEYVENFSTDIADVWANFEFEIKVRKLDAEGQLVNLIKHFAKFDMSPEVLDEYAMGNLFEDLMYRAFSLKGTGAGAFYTPRDAVALMVDVLLASDDRGLTEAGARPVRSVYDPTAGTAGMLIYGAKGIKKMNPHATVDMFGQELMPIGYAIGKSDVLIAGGRSDALLKGNTLTDDLYEGKTFDYVLSNPPFGTDWEDEYDEVEKEAALDGSRFSHGLPKKSDGQMLFLSHVAHKLRPAGPDGAGGRGAVVSNGSPLAGGTVGMDGIRAWLLKNDLIDCIIQLPKNMFYGTDLVSYVWILDTNKESHRKGKVQLINASSMWRQMDKGMGEKRRYIDSTRRKEILREYVAFEESEFSKIFTPDDLGFKDVPVRKQARYRIEVTEVAKETLRLKKGITEPMLELVNGLEAFEWPEVDDELKRRAKAQGIKMTAAQRKTIILGVSVHDEKVALSCGNKGNPLSLAGFAKTERVALSEDVDEHMRNKVVPFVSDVFWDESAAKVGYEIPFTRIFYKPETVRSLDKIDADVQNVMGVLGELFQEVKAK